jgi:hypothetical protein
MEHEGDLSHLSANQVKFMGFTYILAQQRTKLNESPSSVTSPHSIGGLKIVEIMGVFAP